MADKTVGDFFGKDPEIRTYREDETWVLPNTMVGLEIELEGFDRRPTIPPPYYWTFHEEGSLRDINGLRPFEFVFSMPFCGYDLSRALQVFDKIIKSLKSKPHTSPRGSTHVHLDVREFTLEQVISLITFYTIVERPLYRYCGSRREDNNFCLPFYKAEAVVFSNLSRYDVIKQNGRSLSNVTATETYRYNGLNVCSLRKFGTIEFRQYPSCADVSQITEWINIIMCLKKAVIENKHDIGSIPVEMSRTGILESVQKIFGPYFNRLFYPEMEYDLYQGIRLAQNILYKEEQSLAELDLSSSIFSPAQHDYTYLNQAEKLFGLKKTKNKEEKITSATTIYDAGGFVVPQGAVPFDPGQWRVEPVPVEADPELAPQREPELMFERLRAQERERRELEEAEQRAMRIRMQHPNQRRR